VRFATERRPAFSESLRWDVTYGVGIGCAIGFASYLRDTDGAAWWLRILEGAVILAVGAGLLGWILRKNPGLYRPPAKRSSHGHQRPTGNGGDDADIDQS